MKQMVQRICALTVAALLLTGGALADTLPLEGTVGGDAVAVYAPIGGTVESVQAVAGQTVNQGDVLASLTTTKVYAAEAGTITGVFGQPGDNAETIGDTYGAVIYMEGESVYSISASTSYAYSKRENKFIHVGESVYLSCSSDGEHTGAGIITALDGTSYTVRVNSGVFTIGENVFVYRGDSAVAANRIGRGRLSRTSPTAVTGTGSLVSIAVKEGDTVQRGDLLFETLTGDFDGLTLTGSQLTATTGGIVAQVNVAAGDTVEKGAVVATVYPKLRVEAAVSEYNLGMVHVGDGVTVELLWNQESQVTYPGTVAAISAIPDTSDSTSSDVKYTVYIDFEGDQDTRYGMSAVVTLGQE